MSSLEFVTAGESHGKGLVIMVKGMVADLPLSEEYIAAQLARRQLGYGRGGRMKIEKDFAEIISGVRHGPTLGSPISMLLRNRDWENWTTKMAIEPVEEEIERVTRLRPGHADLAGAMKYDQSDIRNILERSSARETAARVAAGAVARRFLEEFGIILRSHVLSIGGEWIPSLESIDWDVVEASQVRCADPATEQRMIDAIKAAKKEGDTVGGAVEVIAEGVPVGLGSHTHWDTKLEGRIGQAFLSIHAVKAVSVGDGVGAADRRGSKVHDVVEPFADGRWTRKTNNAGGIEGGMSTGEPISVTFFLKPISTMAHPLPPADLLTGELVEAHYERSDVCVVPAAGVIGEAMLAIVLANAFFEKFGGDSLAETRRNYEGFLRTVGPKGRAGEAAL